MELEQSQREFALKFRISYEEYKILVTSMTTDEVITCLELLRAKKHKSKFRERMETQIREWLAHDYGNSKPLTDKDFMWARPKWPIHYQLPR